MESSAVILAGGSSTRFGQDKGLVRLAGKPLVKHVLEAVGDLAEEKLVVVSSKAQADSYMNTLGSNVHVVVDAGNVQAPLMGASAGFQAARGKYTLLLPCDAPFVSKEILALLLDLCTGKTATIPRWPNCQIEPLQAAYQTKLAFDAATDALKSGELRMQTMINKLRGIRYVSTLVLQQLDPQLITFFNVNTPQDLKKAETMLSRQLRR